MKNSILIFFLICGYNIFSQDNSKYRYEIDLGHDNDFFIIYAGTDRYYTYGINTAIRWNIEKEHFYFKKNANYQDHFNEINFNVEAYTPDYLSDGSVDPNEERPYAGWSYLNYSQSLAFSKSFLRLGMDVGILGPDSKAGEIQNWFHRQITGDPELQGWEDQLPNQLGINIRTKYGTGLWYKGLFDIFTTVDVSLGNIYIYARPMINARFGKFAPIQYSVSQGNQLLAPKKQIEYFINLGVGAKVSAYNATVQGNIFKNNDLFTQDEINNFILNSYFGICVLLNKTSIKINYNLTTGTLNSSEVNRYGSLSLTQRF